MEVELNLPKLLGSVCNELNFCMFCWDDMNEDLYKRIEAVRNQVAKIVDALPPVDAPLFSESG